MELGRAQAHTGTVHVALVEGEKVLSIQCGAGKVHGVSNGLVARTEDRVTCERCRASYKPEYVD